MTSDLREKILEILPPEEVLPDQLDQLVELFDEYSTQAVKEERERTIHEIGLEFNDLVQNEGSFADYAFETLEWFKKHDKLLHQSEEEK